MGGVVAALLALGACGGGGGGGSDAGAAGVVRGAVERLARGTVHVRTVARGSADGRPVVVRVTAAIDFRSRDSLVTGGGADGVPNYELRVVDGITYLESRLLPASSSAGPGVAAGPAQPTKPWFEVRDADLADLGDEFRPERLLARVRTAAGVEAAGTDRVGGLRTTRYRLTFTGRGRHQPDTGTVWVDRAGRLRRLSVRGRDRAAPASVTTEVTRIGAPVVVTAPPADQVFDLTRPPVPDTV